MSSPMPLGRSSTSNSEDVSFCERAKAVLRSSGYFALARVQCEIFNGVVVLSGEVPSFYLKQLAQALVSTLSLHREVRNQVLVK